MKMHENRNSSMESFYEDNGQYVATTTASRSVNNIKRPISLDLNLATNNSKQVAGKKQRCNQSVIPQTVLNSPDINMLKWGTPDLEKYILSNDPLQTPTPSLIFTANPIGPAKVIIIIINRIWKFNRIWLGFGFSVCSDGTIFFFAYTIQLNRTNHTHIAHLIPDCRKSRMNRKNMRNPL